MGADNSSPKSINGKYIKVPRHSICYYPKQASDYHYRIGRFEGPEFPYIESTQNDANPCNRSTPAAGLVISVDRSGAGYSLRCGAAVCSMGEGRGVRSSVFDGWTSSSSTGHRPNSAPRSLTQFMEVMRQVVVA